MRKSLIVALTILLVFNIKAQAKSMDKELKHLKSGSKLLGVFSGLGRCFNVDANILRILFLFATFFSYFVAFIFGPFIMVMFYISMHVIMLL
jgi:phage shock protein PspC (stress-responsive transcriptional regulator)